MKLTGWWENRSTAKRQSTMTPGWYGHQGTCSGVRIIKQTVRKNLACENSRFSSLFAAEDVSRTFLRAKRPQRRRARRNGCFRRLKKPSRTHVSLILRLTQACLPENVVWFLSSNCETPHKRMQHSWATTPNTVGCYMLRPVAHPVACCCAKFETGQTLSKQLPTFLLLRNRRSVAQQCWIRLHSLRPRTRRITHGLLGAYKILWVVSFPRPTAGPINVGVVASVCT